MHVNLELADFSQPPRLTASTNAARLSRMQCASAPPLPIYFSRGKPDAESLGKGSVGAENQLTDPPEGLQADGGLLCRRLPRLQLYIHRSHFHSGNCAHFWLERAELNRRAVKVQVEINVLPGQARHLL